jgi:hypothetical protein
MKDHIFLDNLEWVSFVSQIEGCPDCKHEQISFGPDMYYPFVKHLTNKELNRESTVTRPMSRNIK